MVSAQLADPRFTGSVPRGPFFLEKKASSSARGRLGPQLVHTAADSFVLVCERVFFILLNASKQINKQKTNKQQENNPSNRVALAYGPST